MSLSCLEGRYTVVVPYRGSATIKNLIQKIQESNHPEPYMDSRLTDDNFPHPIVGDVPTTIEVVSFNPGWKSKEDGRDFLRVHGYVPANAAELLTLRATHPEHRGFRSRVAAVGASWRDARGYPYVPCLGNAYGDGLRLRILTGGWVPFWTFAVKRAESE